MTDAVFGVVIVPFISYRPQASRKPGVYPARPSVC